MRRQIKSGISRALALTGADRLIGAISGAMRSEMTGAHGGPLIVGYHRVVKDRAALPPGSIRSMVVTARTFEKHVDWLARRYRLMTLDEIGARLEQGGPFEDRPAAITFDDGYVDLYENALPILRRKGIPAAVFVVTDLVGGSRMQNFDRLSLSMCRLLWTPGGAAWLRERLRIHAVHATRAAALGSSIRLPDDPHAATQVLLAALPQEELCGLLDELESRCPPSLEEIDAHRALTWEMLAEMHGDGFTIGSHTRSHPLLTLEDAVKIRDEVFGSRRQLQRRLRVKVDHFAYPDGRFGPGVVDAVRAAGYRFAYGICAHCDARAPLLTLPRRMLWENSCVDARGRFSASVMSCNINGVFDPFDPCCRNHDAVAPEAATAAAAAENRSHRRWVRNAL